MLKMDFCMIVHNGQPFLELNLRALYPLANKIILVEGPVSIYSSMGFGPSTDGTLDLIRNFPDPGHKIILESGFWEEKDQMVRAQEKHFSGEFCWAIDADEFYHIDDMYRVIELLENNKHIYSMSFRLLSFYGNFDRTIGGFEAEFEVHRIQKLSLGAKWLSHRPPTMLYAPTGKTCRQMGHVDGTAELGVRIYHMSHMPPKRMAHKSRYYEKFSSSIIPDYFNQVYLPWITARSDIERLVIENKFQGVQEFRPECRTPAFTVPFVGKLPYIIEQNREIIETQIKTELWELGIR